MTTITYYRKINGEWKLECKSELQAEAAWRMSDCNVEISKGRIVIEEKTTDPEYDLLKLVIEENIG